MWRRLMLLAAVATIGLAACKPTDNPTGDGLSAPNAGASCWGIKQAFPASTDGLYWLLNPSIDRPTQFYCDMTTAGGGWVLIGRGRDTWNFDPGGQGTAGAVRNITSGSAAFNAAALSPKDINGLMNSAPVSGLTDGIRLERATNSSGTSWQDMRLFPQYDKWTWALPQGQRLTHMSINGTNYANGNTSDTYSNFYDYPTSGLRGRQSTSRLRTASNEDNGWHFGFGYGSGISGSNNSTSYLWRYNSGGWVLPFTRVWLRPQIANGSFTNPDIPAAGFPAQANPPGLKNSHEAAPYGVVGTNHTDEENIEPWNTTVSVMKAYGDRVFVGGRFTGVQAGYGASPAAQKSLAAFDLDGNWISSFNPVIDGRVWDMTMTPDGKLIIGGDFLSVDGLPNTAGLAALDPTTGEVITGWHANVTYTSGRAIVRALDSGNGWIYAAGKFNRVQGGTWNQITVSSAISLNTTDGSPGTWKPILSGTAVRVRAAAAGDRVYLAGYFDRVNGDTNHGYHAITAAATGVPVPGMGPWQPSIGSNARYQQAVAENGSEILVGGSEHDTQIYNHDRTTMIDSNITKQGGDTQAIEVFGNQIYVGCHCDDTLFQGTNNWDEPAGFRSASAVNTVFRMDSTTHNVDTSWFPGGLKGAAGEGTWTITQDQRGCVWIGGDFVKGSSSGNPATDWLGGFARYCPTDSNPPTAPTALMGTADDSGVMLSWAPSADDSGSVSYDIYRNNRVIASVGGTTFTDPSPISTSTYTVRAYDPSGNRSASAAPIDVSAVAPVVETQVDFGGTWKYSATGADQGTAWQAPGYDDSTWPSGPAQFGWGTGTEGTVLTAHPLTSYYRKSVSITDVTKIKRMRVELSVNAGAVIYDNGLEVGRENMPAGAITASTPAAAYICCGEEARIKTVDIPASLLQSGTNTLAVEMHAWSPTAGRALLNVKATTRSSNGDSVPPAAASLSAAPGATNGIDLSWTPATDNAGVAGYILVRNGQPLAAMGPATTSWSDQGVTGGSPYSYVVRAFDLNGNLTSSNSVAVNAPTNAQLLAFNSTWSWYNSEVAPPTDWATPAFDASGWASGPGELGYGDSPKGTVISPGPAPYPLTSYYRTTVNITNPAEFSSITLGLIRNSGAAVYVNGVEVARSNLPDGILTPGTYASGSVPAAERHVPVTFSLPTSTFTPGVNTIAVELHLNSRNQTAAGVDVSLTGQR